MDKGPKGLLVEQMCWWVDLTMGVVELLYSLLHNLLREMRCWWPIRLAM